MEEVKCGCVADDHELGRVDSSACILPEAVEKIRAELAQCREMQPADTSYTGIFAKGLEFALKALGVEP